MTTLEAKRKIDATGQALLTLANDQGEWVFVGQIDKMTSKDGRIRLQWKLPAASHVSPFTKAVVSGTKVVLYQENINPLRLDMGTKKFDLVWDV